MQPYIPHLSHHIAPLRELLKKNQVFYWDDNVTTTLHKLKSFISKTPLQYYQRDLLISIQVDASKHGVDICLLQHGKPTAFVPKFLMHTETQYSSPEWQLLAIIYAYKCFHMYIYGCSFTTETDHKPLGMISLKNPTAVFPHLQKNVPLLTAIDTTIRYRPQNKMQLPEHPV